MPALNLPDMHPSLNLKPGYLQHSLWEKVAGTPPPARTNQNRDKYCSKKVTDVFEFLTLDVWSHYEANINENKNVSPTSTLRGKKTFLTSELKFRYHSVKPHMEMFKKNINSLCVWHRVKLLVTNQNKAFMASKNPLLANNLVYT